MAGADNGTGSQTANATGNTGASRARTFPCCRATDTEKRRGLYGFRQHLTPHDADDKGDADWHSRAMSTPVSSIPNLGPAMERDCARAGITCAEDLRALGADEAYGRMIATGLRPHFIGYYVLVMALQGRPWNDCKGAEKTALRVRFDALKATHLDTDLRHLESVLDAIGVIAPERLMRR